MFATESEAHAEWHRNAGVPMGTPGCPQDACHPPDPDPEPPVLCGRCHQYHEGVYEVRVCYRRKAAGLEPMHPMTPEDVAYWRTD